MSGNPKEPEAWKKLGDFLHQDFFVAYPDFWSGIDRFAKSISGAERKELIRFIQPLVETEQPGGKLKKLWFKSGAQVMPARMEAKALFTELFQHISAASQRS